MSTTSGDQAPAPYTGTTEWMGRTLTFEYVWRMVNAGIDPWTGLPTTLEKYKAEREIA